MSHSTCMIVLPREPESAEDLDSLLRDALAPFDENLDVEPYKKRVRPLPEGWQVTKANSDRFKRLLDSGVERRIAWEQVWGKENTDPDIPLERSVAMDHGIDGEDDQGIADFLLSHWDDKYEVDEEGLYSWSTYNPQSKWDWWSLGGRWTGYFQVRAEATCYLGTPGVFGNAPPVALGTKPGDACRRGDVDVDGMTLARAVEAGGWWDEAHRKWPHDEGARKFMSDVEPGESRDAFILRKSEPAELLRPFAVLAEGAWREAGRMGWFGVDSSTEESREDYAAWFARFWQAMPDETWVAVCDLHI